VDHKGHIIHTVSVAFWQLYFTTKIGLDWLAKMTALHHSGLNKFMNIYIMPLICIMWLSLNSMVTSITTHSRQGNTVLDVAIEFSVTM